MIQIALPGSAGQWRLLWLLDQATWQARDSVLDNDEEIAEAEPPAAVGALVDLVLGQSACPADVATQTRATLAANWPRLADIARGNLGPAWQRLPTEWRRERFGDVFVDDRARLLVSSVVVGAAEYAAVGWAEHAASDGGQLPVTDRVAPWSSFAVRQLIVDLVGDPEQPEPDGVGPNEYAQAWMLALRGLLTRALHLVDVDARARAVRLARTERGWTRRQLAQDVGVSTDTLSRAELGTASHGTYRGMDDGLWRRAASALGLDERFPAPDSTRPFFEDPPALAQERFPAPEQMRASLARWSFYLGSSGVRLGQRPGSDLENQLRDARGLDLWPAGPRL